MSGLGGRGDGFQHVFSAQQHRTTASKSKVHAQLLVIQLPPLLVEDLDQRDRVLVFLSFPCRLHQRLEVELFSFLDPLLVRPQQLLSVPEPLSFLLVDDILD